MVICLVGIVVLGKIIAVERGQVLDEMELTVIAVWIGLVTIAARIGAHSFWHAEPTS